MIISHFDTLFKMAAGANLTSRDQELLQLLRDSLVATETHVSKMVDEPLTLCIWGKCRNNNSVDMKAPVTPLVDRKGSIMEEIPHATGRNVFFFHSYI